MTTVYFQMSKNVKVHHEKVLLNDIAQVFCQDESVKKKCEAVCVRDLTGLMPGSYIILAMDVVKIITSIYVDAEVVHMGEVAIAIMYEPNPLRIGVWDYVKTAFVSLILFFGAGFSIMTFNTDVNTKELFSSLHEELLGIPSSGFTEMELLYSIGIGIGVVFFFNHFSFKNKKKDPTALEVKMCLYENDIETTVIEQESQNGNE